MKMTRVSLQWKRETLFDSFHFGWTNSPLCEQCAGRIVPGTNTIEFIYTVFTLLRQYLYLR